MTSSVITSGIVSSVSPAPLAMFCQVSCALRAGETNTVSAALITADNLRPSSWAWARPESASGRLASVPGE